MVKESCSNCRFYKQDEDGKFYCKDCDGLYFNWPKKPEQHCPDYKRTKDVVQENLKAV